jgi:hypothetical protein
MNFYLTNKKICKLEKIAKRDELYMHMYANSLKELFKLKDKFFELKHSIYEKIVDNRRFSVVFINKKEVVLSKPMYRVFFEQPKEKEIKYKEDKHTSSLF